MMLFNQLAKLSFQPLSKQTVPTVKQAHQSIRFLSQTSKTIASTFFNENTHQRHIKDHENNMRREKLAQNLLSNLSRVYGQSSEVKKALRRAVLFYDGHYLGSTPWLFEPLIKLGLPPENIVGATKIISDRPKVIKWFRQQGAHIFSPRRALTIQDDLDKERGLLIEEAMDKAYEICERVGNEASQLPLFIRIASGGSNNIHPIIRRDYPCCALEWTTYGTFSPEPLDYTRMAFYGSATKCHAEGIFIAESLTNAVNSIITTQYQGRRLSVGIVGNGTVGGAMVEVLSKHKHVALKVYDISPEVREKYRSKLGGRSIAASAEEIFQSVDIAFCCTGHDVTKRLVRENPINPIAHFRNGILLVSGSTAFAEFESLRKWAIDSQPKFGGFRLPIMANLPVQGGNIVAQLHAGGAPANLVIPTAGEIPSHAVSPEKIALIRLLAAGSVIDMATILAKHGLDMQVQEQAINPVLQRWAWQHFSTLWEEHTELFGANMCDTFSPATLSMMQDIESIKQSSVGSHIPNPMLERLLMLDMENNCKKEQGKSPPLILHDRQTTPYCNTSPT